MRTSQLASRCLSRLCKLIVSRDARAPSPCPSPSHVCLVCQLEFSSLPLGSTMPFTWTIGLVIDRGYPKLCFPKSLAPLDPLMRDQCRVAVPGLSATRAKQLSVSTPSSVSITVCHV